MCLKLVSSGETARVFISVGGVIPPAVEKMKKENGGDFKDATADEFLADYVRRFDEPSIDD